MIESFSMTFFAALRSVGTVGTMAFAGFYLHRRNFITIEAKKGLAKLSQQVTIPALFFSKIVYCPQNGSTDSCPDITQKFGEAWILLLWPIYVVGCGLLVGHVAAWVSDTPPRQRRIVLAACAFANSTGLPITLLTVIHANFPANTEIGALDPNLLLSIYLLIYPILQWGIAGWLLTPVNDDDKEVICRTSSSANNEVTCELICRTSSTGVRHVLNMPNREDVALQMIKELSGVKRQYDDTPKTTEETNLLGMENTGTVDTFLTDPNKDIAPLTETLARVLPKALQPPVIAGLLGIIVACSPKLRGLFVDTVTRSNKAPLEWLFDGIYSIGNAAVPINMCILGINLSLASSSKNKTGNNQVSARTIAAIVISKMIVMPAIGILTVLILKNFVLNVPSPIDGPFYLVMMIVTIAPTANNVMVMVELSGGNKESMARIIAWQYACAPVLLCITVTLVVRVASMW